MELGEEELTSSVKRYYKESLKHSLGQCDFNFVLSDPRLPDNPIVYASEGFCSMSGYEHHEVIGRNCRFLQGPDTDRRTVLEIRDAVREERPCQVHILNYTKHGNPFWNLFYMAPVYSRKDGTVVHFVGVQTPFSAAATAAAAPLASKKLNLMDAEKRKEARSECLQQIQGEAPMRVWFALNEIQGCVCFVEADEQEDNHKCVAKDEDKGRAACAVQTILCNLMENSRIGGGGRGVAETRCKEIAESAVGGVVCSSLMLSLTRIQQSFVLADPKLPDIPIVHASKVFCEITGYSQEEVIGRNCRFLQGPDTDPEAIRKSIAGEHACTVRILNYRKDKTSFWNHLHLSPVRSATGEVAFYVGVQLAMDIVDSAGDENVGMTPYMKQLGAVGAVKVAVRSLQGSGLRRSFKKNSEE
ncbi:unnamed protein product [Sphagnum troendelagicum]|uniref:PAS domain-containing protein n=1 Tax=Sphagnum troendelagicum TaxID=128251 RepID=A0ABP0TZ07_9BRYO